MYPTGSGPLAVVARNGLKAWDGYNDTMRTAIVTNPFVHPIWNLAWNSLGAGMPVHEVANLVTRNVVSTFGGQKLLDRFMPRSAQYQQWVEDAIKAGASAEMRVGGRDTTMALGQSWHEVKNPGEFARKLFAESRAWNMRHTFGPEGEQAFATALFRHFMKNGLSHDEAAGQVREALGNYQNINRDPVSFDGLMTRLLFFYPWLKGNSAAWVRWLGTNPRVALAPADAARMNNALARDPNEKKTRARDYQWEHKGLGGPANIGGDPNTWYRYTPLTPQRILADVFDVTSGDPTKAVRAVDKVASSHFNPGVRAMHDLGETALLPVADPAQPQNSRTVYDKDAPPEVQRRQAAAYAAGHLAPIPLVGFQAGDAIREGGIPSNEVGPFALGAIGGGYARPETHDTPEDRQIRRARGHLNSAFIKANKINKRNPDRADALRRRAYETYEKIVKRANEKAAKRSKDAVVDKPPGM